MTEHLDPDEVDCPRCAARVGSVCRTPAGRKARTVHRERRELAASVERGAEPDRPPTEPTSRQKSGRRKVEGTAEGRRKGGQAAQAKRRERRSEIERLRLDAEARALAERAQELADDATRWDTVRMRLRALVLQDAVAAWATFGEVLQSYRRVMLDELGRPRELIVEREGRDGEPVRRKALDYRGQFGPDDVKALATAAGIALDKVRLEEGSATSRSELVGGSPDATGYAEASDDDLRRLIDTARAALDEARPDEEGPA